MGAIMAAGSKIVLRDSLVAVALTAAALLPSIAVLATVDSPPSRLAPAGDALAPDTMQTGSIEHPARVAPARQASAPNPFRTRIVVVEWKIKKGREAEFLDYWSTRSTIPDRSGLIGEFLSGVRIGTAFRGSTGPSMTVGPPSTMWACGEIAPTSRGRSENSSTTPARLKISRPRAAHPRISGPGALADRRYRSARIRSGRVR